MWPVHGDRRGICEAEDARFVIDFGMKTFFLTSNPGDDLTAVKA